MGFLLPSNKPRTDNQSTRKRIKNVAIAEIIVIFQMGHTLVCIYLPLFVDFHSLQGHEIIKIATTFNLRVTSAIFHLTLSKSLNIF